MKSTRLTSMLLGCAVLASLSLVAQAAPDKVFKGNDKIKLGPVVILPERLPDMAAYAGAPIPLMADALNYARTGNVAKGTRAAVYATVVITSAASQTTPGRSSVEYGHALLSLVGAKGQEHFAGDLAIARNMGDEATPFRASTSGLYSKRLSIYANGHVAIRTTYRTKRPSTTVSFTSDGSDGFLWGRDTSGTNSQLISVALAKSVSPLSGVSQPASTSPVGMRVEVSGEFTVMNANDGTTLFKPDRTMELHGVLYFGTHANTKRRMWFREASNPLSKNKGNVIQTGAMIMNISYADPDSWRLKVWGGLADYDAQSDPDILWNSEDSVRNEFSRNEYNIKSLVEQKVEFMMLKGVPDDEYADFKLKIRKIADIY